MALLSVDFAGLGALFLLSLLAPAFVGGAPVLTTASSNTPGLVVIGVIGAVGFGALLRLTGDAVWNWVWPISPTSGWKGVLPRQLWPGKHNTEFRTDIACDPALADVLACAADVVAREGRPGPHRYKEGDCIVITAEFLFYSKAEPELREWVRRRYMRFSGALSVVAAICLGVGGSLLFPGQNAPWIGWVLDVALLAVALVTFLFAHESRREAEDMQVLWYKLRKPEDPVTHVAFEPKTQLVVHPRLWEPGPPR